MASQFNAKLMPTFQNILSSPTCEEFGPYVFQLITLLAEFQQGVSDMYKSLFGSIMRWDVWENHGNVPALTRLLSWYCRIAPDLCGQNVTKLLGIFQKLLTIRALDQYSLELLSVVVENIFPYAVSVGSRRVGPVRFR